MKVLTPIFTILPEGCEWTVVIPDSLYRTDEMRYPVVVSVPINEGDRWSGWQVFSRHGNDQAAAEEMKLTLLAVQEIHNS
jgi:hypothetical protein